MAITSKPGLKTRGMRRKKLYFTPNTRADKKAFNLLLKKHQIKARWNDSFESYVFDSREQIKQASEKIKPDIGLIRGNWETI